MRSNRGWISRNLLVLIIGGSGVLHFLVPKFYQRIVPRALGHQEEIVAISGAAEIGCAALMVLPRTRRIGGWLTAALLLAVWPANFQQAFDGKPYSRTGVLSSPALLWWRLPLQVPLIRMALRVARDGQVGDRTPATVSPG